MLNKSFIKIYHLISLSLKRFIWLSLILFIAWMTTANLLFIDSGSTALIKIQIQDAEPAGIPGQAVRTKLETALQNEDVFNLALSEYSGVDDKSVQESNLLYTFDRNSTTGLNIQFRHRKDSVASGFLKHYAGWIQDRYTIQLKKDKQNIIQTAGEELKSVKAVFDSAAQKLIEFKQSHPWVAMPGDVAENIQKTSYLELSKARLQSETSRLVLIIDRAEANSVPDSVLIAEINPLIKNSSGNGKDEGRKAYSQTELLERARNQLVVNQAELNDIDTRIANDRLFKMHTLPEKEMEYDKLMRAYSIAEKLYTEQLEQFKKLELMTGKDNPEFTISEPVIIRQDNLIRSELKYAAIGLLLSIALSLVVLILPKSLKQIAVDAETTGQILDLPVLIRIPKIGTTNGHIAPSALKPGAIDPNLITANYAPSLASEAYRDLRTRLLFGSNGIEYQTLQITSGNCDEGKSLTAANLAVTMAQQKIQTVLIDLDLRRGILHNIFGLEKSPGIGDFFIKNIPFSEDILGGLIRKTHIPNLFLVTSGKPIPNPSEALGSDRFAEMLDFYKDRFPMLILDTPPLEVASDAVILSKLSDAVMLVVRGGSTRLGRLKEKLTAFQDFSNKLIGVIYNFDEHLKERKTTYSYYNY